jgi:hypothetical protein
MSVLHNYDSAKIKRMPPPQDGAPLGEALRAGSEMFLIAGSRNLSIALKLAIFDPYERF